MRISDWSSDVCSSDLVLVAAVLLVVRDTDMWISKETRAVRLGGRACRRTTIEAMHRVPPLRCCVPVSQARGKVCDGHRPQIFRSEEHTSELQSLMRTSYAVFCLQKQQSPLTTH